jgi:hypothetical protein
MAEHYIYRFFQGTWGIYVDMTAKAVPLATFRGVAYEVERGLFISLAKWSGIILDDIPYLCIGLRLVADDMQPVIAQTGPIVIHVLHVDFTPTDYQSEGVAYAMAGWMQQKFQLPDVRPPVSFDHTKKCYIFSLPEKTPHDEDITRQIILHLNESH